MSPRPSWEQRRTWRYRFDRVVASYQRARPGYPQQLWDQLWRLAGLGASPRVLEIGCGTGQATLPLLRRGARVLAIELSARMAAQARAELGEFAERATIVHAGFESWVPPDGEVDLVLSANAFHWLDPQLREAKIAGLLGEGGYLAVIGDRQVSDGRGDHLFRRSQAAYARAFGPGYPTEVLPDSEALGPQALDEARFETVAYRQFHWQQRLDSDGYLDLLRSHTSSLELSAARREGMLAELRALVDDSFGGEVTRQLVASLTLARRR